MRRLFFSTLYTLSRRCASTSSFLPDDLSTWGINNATDPVALAKEVLPEVMKIKAYKDSDPKSVESMVISLITSYQMCQKLGLGLGWKSVVRPRATSGGMDVDVKKMLQWSLNNTETPEDMPLQGRDAVLGDITDFIASGAEKNTAWLLLSPRGSGKTQLLKWLLGVSVSEMTGRGSIAVVECKHKTAPYKAILDALPRDPADLTSDVVDAFLCAIICRHLNTFHRHPKTHYIYNPPAGASWKPPSDTPPTSLSSTYIHSVMEAYDAWTQECGERPVLVFDTVEALPLRTAVPCTSPERKASKETRSFIEEMAVSLPSQRKVLFVGTQAGGLDPMELDPTDCKCRVLAPLSPLNLEQFLATFPVWCLVKHKRMRKDVITLTTDDSPEKRTLRRIAQLVHELCGGLPRYLNYFAGSAASYPLLAVGVCWPYVINSVVSDLKELYGAHALTHHEIMGLLIAGTRHVVADLDNELVLGRSLRSLCAGLLLPVGGPKRWQFNVAPLLVKALLDDAAVPGIMEKANLPPFPRNLVLSSLFVPDIASAFQDIVANHNKVRGTKFEELVAHALVARHYLLRVTSGDPEVPLADLLGTRVGGDDWKVNFSGGLKVCPTYPGIAEDEDDRKFVIKSQQQNATHDIVFWASSGTEQKRIALQLRHGGAKTASELVTQMSDTYKVDLLLVVHQKEYTTPTFTGQLKKYNGRVVFVDASKFCLANTPYIVSPGSTDITPVSDGPQ